MRVTASMIAVVLLLAGCGGSNQAGSNAPGSPTSAPATSVTPSTAASSSASPKPATPAVLTREQAAKRYLQLVAASNTVFDEPKCEAAEEYMINGGTWPPDGHSEYGEHAFKVLRECHKRLLPLFAATIKAFQTTPWPVDARADIEALISLDQAFLYCEQKASKATSDSAMYKALECFPEDDGSADRVRARFGLPGRDEE
jgi:hypothetical protein